MCFFKSPLSLLDSQQWLQLFSIMCEKVFYIHYAKCAKVDVLG